MEEGSLFSNIVVPTDGSQLAVAAVEKAVGFARDADASITFVSVVEPFRIFSTDSEQLSNTREEYKRLADTQAHQSRSEAEMKARQQGVVCGSVRIDSADVHSAIIKVAVSNGCDVIATASHGRGEMGTLLLGRVTSKVLTHSCIPVLVYR